MATFPIAKSEVECIPARFVFIGQRVIDKNGDILIVNNAERIPENDTFIVRFYLWSPRQGYVEADMMPNDRVVALILN